MARGYSTSAAPAATKRTIADLRAVLPTKARREQPPDSGTLQTFVTFYLEKLGFTIVNDEDMSHITFKKESDKLWKKHFQLSFSISVWKIVKADVCPTGNESDNMHFKCSSLNNLRIFLREARENRKESVKELGSASHIPWDDRDKRELEHLSSWDVASCIVMWQAINHQIVVSGMCKDACSWATRWMLAASACDKPNFLVDSPLRLPKGLVVNVTKERLEILVTPSLSLSYAKLVERITDSVHQSQACDDAKKTGSTKQVRVLSVPWKSSDNRAEKEFFQSVSLVTKNSESSKKKTITKSTECPKQEMVPSSSVPIYFW